MQKILVLVKLGTTEPLEPITLPKRIIEIFVFFIYKH